MLNEADSPAGCEQANHFPTVNASLTILAHFAIGAGAQSMEQRHDAKRTRSRCESVSGICVDDRRRVGRCRSYDSSDYLDLLMTAPAASGLDRSTAPVLDMSAVAPRPRIARDAKLSRNVIQVSD